MGARLIAGILIVVAAAGIWVAMWPPAQHGTSSSNLASIRSEDSLNQTRTEGAPQQAVVNGWTTRDLMFAMAEEQKAANNRTTALLGIGVIGIALAIMLPARKSIGRDPLLAFGPSVQGPGAPPGAGGAPEWR